MKAIIAILMLFPVVCYAQKTQIKGAVRFGPEAMYFVKCGSDQKWWLGDQTFKAEGWKTVASELKSQPLCDLSTMPCEHQAVVVAGTALISKKGEYGHLGQYEREIYFTQLSSVLGDDCKI